MAIETEDMESVSGGKARAGRRPAGFTRLVTMVRRLFGHVLFSSLTRRILSLNLLALFVLVTGILYLNQFREGLIDARVESLLTQGEIIAGAIAASASVDTNSITIDPEKLLELQAGQTIKPSSSDSLDFPINPERVAPVLRRLISPTRTRARIFDEDASLLLDSRYLYTSGQVLRFDLPSTEPDTFSFDDRIWAWFNRLFQRRDLPLYREPPGADGTIYPEVMNALTGSRGAIVRVNEKGELIVSVAVPIQRFRAVLGVLLLSTQAGDIDKIVHAERMAIFRVFGVAALVNVILSLLLASTIATPLRRLSAAAVRVRRGAREREEIPNFSARQDEIGNLSVALRDMTNALYDRIDAIESFAADVSHELKNPLTSLRSAVETLPVARTPESQKRLLDVIQHDVRRMDRLISDISDASRLDAELARQDSAIVDMRKLLGDLVGIAKQVGRKERTVDITFHVDGKADDKTDFRVYGHDLRLGQVITNLIENARSFVPQDAGEISVHLSRRRNNIRVSVADNGPGIRAENIERVFERFYTDRPDGEDFGQNSGLGLSISRQIIEAHGGRLYAENIPLEPKPAKGKKGAKAATREADERKWTGARFVVDLPAADI